MPGALTWKGFMGMCGPWDPFCPSPAVHKTPSWRTSPLSRPSFERMTYQFVSKINYFQKIWQCSTSEAQILLWFLSKPVLKPLFLMKICSQVPTFTAFIRSQAPSLEIQVTRTYRKKLSATPGNRCQEIHPLIGFVNSSMLCWIIDWCVYFGGNSFVSLPVVGWKHEKAKLKIRLSYIYSQLAEWAMDVRSFCFSRQDMLRWSKVISIWGPAAP